MKNLLLTALAALLFPMISLAEEAPAPLPTPSPVDGRWTLVDRSCSSGAPVIDDFVLGRDSWSLSFSPKGFESVRSVSQCKYWSSGNYSVRGNMLELTDIIGASNCTNQRPYPRSTNVFVVQNQVLKIFVNVNTVGAACPRGDLLESVFLLGE